MKRRCIHVMGASGSGATSLGRALAGALELPHHDADDYLWLPTVHLIARSARSGIGCG
jgi:adenylate kinase family enzyme